MVRGSIFKSDQSLDYSVASKLQHFVKCGNPLFKCRDGGVHIKIGMQHYIRSQLKVVLQSLRPQAV